jgi:mRNA interferase YafQ
MLEIVRSSQFKKDLKKIMKQGKNLKQLERVINHLRFKKELPKKHHDHNLAGECWVIENAILILIGF